MYNNFLFDSGIRLVTSYKRYKQQSSFRPLEKKENNPRRMKEDMVETSQKEKGNPMSPIS